MTRLSEGAMKLADFARKQPGYRGKEGSIRGLAKMLGKDFPTVLRWVRGERIPEYPGRKLIADVCGIPMDDWDVFLQSKSKRKAAA